MCFAIGTQVVCCFKFMGQGDIDYQDYKEDNERNEPVLNERLLEVLPLEEYDMLNDWVRKEPRLAIPPLALKVSDERLGTFPVKDPGKLYCFE